MLEWDKQYGVYRLKGIPFDVNSYKEYHDITYNCTDCENNFIVRTECALKIVPKCPHCAEKFPIQKGKMKSKGKEKTIKQGNDKINDVIKTRKTPRMKGASVLHKNYDATLQMVAEDYGFTNLNVDNLREGDNLVPKLAPHLEEQVNAAFQPTKNINSPYQTAAFRNQMMQGINSGRFKGEPDVVGMQQKAGITPKTNFIN